MGWIFLLLLIAGCIVAYRYLSKVETEIRAEIAALEQPDTDHPAGDDISLRLLRLIHNRPDILQTDIYKELHDIDRKVLQRALLNLDRSGKILRRKSGSTYKLSLVE